MARARILSTLVLAAVATLLIAPTASAVTPVSVVDGGITYNADSDAVGAGATAITYDGATQGTDVVIPATVNIGGTDYAVTSIGASAFQSQLLTSVIIPNSVITIGTLAFGTNQLASVNIPNSVTTIGGDAFNNNVLTSVTIGDGVTTIGQYAFNNNFLTSVTIPNSVTTIGGNAFHNNLLTSVTIGSSVTTIDNDAFGLNFLTSVTIPGSVTTIGPGAFDTNQLTSVTIPNSVTTIGQYAFNSNLLTSVTIGASVTTIGDNAFGGNTGLASVKFLGVAPTSVGVVAFGPLDAPAGPMISFYDRYVASGYSSPTWTPGGDLDYRSQALATVTFDANGQGTAPAPVDVVLGATVADPGALTATGYAFYGWFTAASGGTAVNFGAAITADTTYYAQWALADTGFDNGPALALSLALIAAGAALVAGRRRYSN